MPAKHDRSTQDARIRYIAEKRKKFSLNLFPEEFDAFRAACERRGTTPTTEIRRFMAEYTAQPDEDDSDERSIVPDYNTMTDIVDLLPRLRAYDSGEDYYILSDLSGYGSAEPVCVTRERAEELAREWDEEDPDAIWCKAGLDDVARYGIEK